MMTVSQPLSVVGLTHASSVMPPVRLSAAASATVTQSLTPSKDSALPNLPPATLTASRIVPWRPPPEESVATVPPVSSKSSARTSPSVLTGGGGGGGGGAGAFTVTLTDAPAVPPWPSLIV